MVVGFKLFVQDPDTVPQLRVPDVLKAVERLLVSVEGFVDIVTEEVAVANSGPGGSILRVEFCHLQVILDGSTVVAFRSIKLRHFAVVLELRDDVRIALLSGWWARLLRSVVLMKRRCGQHLRSVLVEAVGLLVRPQVMQLGQVLHRWRPLLILLLMGWHGRCLLSMRHLMKRGLLCGWPLWLLALVSHLCLHHLLEMNRRVLGSRTWRRLVAEVLMNWRGLELLLVGHRELLLLAKKTLELL